MPQDFFLDMMISQISVRGSQTDSTDRRDGLDYYMFY